MSLLNIFTFWMIKLGKDLRAVHGSQSHEVRQLGGKRLSQHTVSGGHLGSWHTTGSKQDPIHTMPNLHNIG